MKRILKIICFIICVMLITILLTSCNNSDVPYYSSSSSKQNKEYDICIYNFRKDFSESLQELCNVYYSDTGVKIKVFSPENQDDFFEKLYGKLNSYEYPTIYSISSLQELNKLQNDGFCENLESSSLDDFKKIIKSIPYNIKLSLKDSGSFGLPYGLDGYGYIVNLDIIADIFGKSDLDSFIEDLKKSSYKEFENLVFALDKYIKNDKPFSIYLNGNMYSTFSVKGDLSKDLTGVFSVAGSDNWSYVNYIINIAFNSVFDSPSSLFNANHAQIGLLSDPIKKYAQTLDLLTSYTAGATDSLSRSEEYIKPETNNYIQALNNFSNNKSVFINQGNWIHNYLGKYNSDIIDNLDIIPIKLPLLDTDIQRSDLDADKINQSIPVYVSMYYGINAKTSEKEKKLAQEFLVWMYTSETGKKYMENKFNLIPYDSDESFKSSSNLNNSVLKYRNDGNVLSGVYLGSIYSLKTSKLGEEIENNYLTKKNWNSNDYDNISKYAIEHWNQ